MLSSLASSANHAMNIGRHVRNSVSAFVIDPLHPIISFPSTLRRLEEDNIRLNRTIVFLDNERRDFRRDIFDEMNRIEGECNVTLSGLKDTITRIENNDNVTLSQLQVAVAGLCADVADQQRDASIIRAQIATLIAGVRSLQTSRDRASEQLSEDLLSGLKTMKTDLTARIELRVEDMKADIDATEHMAKEYTDKANVELLNEVTSITTSHNNLLTDMVSLRGSLNALEDSFNGNSGLTIDEVQLNVNELTAVMKEQKADHDALRQSVHVQQDFTQQNTSDQLNNLKRKVAELETTATTLTRHSKATHVRVGIVQDAVLANPIQHNAYGGPPLPPLPPPRAPTLYHTANTQLQPPFERLQRYSKKHPGKPKHHGVSRHPGAPTRFASKKQRAPRPLNQGYAAKRIMQEQYDDQAIWRRDLGTMDNNDGHHLPDTFLG